MTNLTSSGEIRKDALHGSQHPHQMPHKCYTHTRSLARWKRNTKHNFKGIAHGYLLPVTNTMSNLRQNNKRNMEDEMQGENSTNLNFLRRDWGQKEHNQIWINDGNSHSWTWSNGLEKGREKRSQKGILFLATTSVPLSQNMNEPKNKKVKGKKLNFMEDV